MELKNQVEKVKTSAQKHGILKYNPENGDEVLVIQEQQINDMYTFSIAAGTAIVINTRYFDVKGKIFSDTFQKFSDNVLRIEPKRIKETKGWDYFSMVFKPGFVRAIDEATWQNKFDTLEHLIDVLENLGKDNLESLFDELKTE